MVGLALDAEGIVPAKKYYDRFGVTFPALVDPDYATQFGAVPKTFFIDEHGVVRDTRNWQQQLQEFDDPEPVTDVIRAQWSSPGSRLDSANLAALAEKHVKNASDLNTATQLASRYLALGLHAEAQTVLLRTIRHHDAKTVARAGGAESRLLGMAYFQLMRSFEGDRNRQTEYATTSYYLNPSIGFAKQIARIIDPQRFDDRADGTLDNPFREATYQRLKRERVSWLAE